MQEDHLDPDRHLWPIYDEYHCIVCGKELPEDIEEDSPQYHGFCSEACENG